MPERIRSKRNFFIVYFLCFFLGLIQRMSYSAHPLYSIQQMAQRNGGSHF